MIPIDLCKANYQLLWITCLKFTKNNAKLAWKEKQSNQNAILLGFKIIDKITDAKNGEKCSKLIYEAIKKFPNTNKFINGDLNKFVLLLRKGVYAYEQQGYWEKCDEITTLNKDTFYSELN